MLTSHNLNVKYIVLGTIFRPRSSKGLAILQTLIIPKGLCLGPAQRGINRNILIKDVAFLRRGSLRSSCAGSSLNVIDTTEIWCCSLREERSLHVPWSFLPSWEIKLLSIITIMFILHLGTLLHSLWIEYLVCIFWCSLSNMIYQYAEFIICIFPLLLLSYLSYFCLNKHASRLHLSVCCVLWLSVEDSFHFKEVSFILNTWSTVQVINCFSVHTDIIFTIT